jgi:hypothetical protein
MIDACGSASRRSTADDIIRYLMGIDEKVESVLAILQREDDEEADA